LIVLLYTYLTPYDSTLYIKIELENIFFSRRFGVKFNIQVIGQRHNT